MKLLKNILFFSIAVILVMAFFEFFLSAAGIFQQAFKIDQEKGERYIPNKTVNTLFIMEGFGLTKTNEKGWLGDNSYKTHEKSKKNIAFIGNSFVASRQVFERDHFLTKAELKLNEAQDKFEVRLLNFGKKNMYLEEVLFLKEEIERDYDPDYMVVFLNERSFGEVKGSQLVPYYEHSNDTLKLNTDFKKSGKFKLYKKLGSITNSSFLYLAYRVKGKIPQAPEILLDKFYKPKKNDIKVEIKLSEIQEKILKELSKDKKVIFLTDLNMELSKLIRPFTEESRIIDLKKVLIEYQQNSGKDPYYWKVSNDIGHWNNEAHTIISEEISKQLRELIE